MEKSDIKNFYELFNYIKDNNTNYIDYLSWDGQKYKYFRKTFTEIHKDVQTCYNNLTQKGIKENSVVYIDIDNSYEFLICDFAVILTGALSVISNSTESLDTIKDRAEQFKAGYLVTRRQLPALGEGIEAMDIKDLFKEERDFPVRKVVYNDRDFSVVFSSGTSGFPKALGITEKGSVESSKHFFDYMGFGSADKFMIYLPLANYQQRFFFWGCLMTSVNIALGDDKSLFYALKEFEPTILLAPPNFYYNLFCLDTKKGLLNKVSDSLNSKFVSRHITHKPIYEALGRKMNYLLTGMAPIDLKVLEHFRDINLEIYQIYGQTEIGMIACNNKKRNKIGMVGKPIIKVYLSEENEIITESDFPIVSGYYNKDNTKDLLGMVRPTGDVGELDEDGFLRINGRKNETIILNNGVKINPNMIENKIKSSLQVTDIVIFKTQQKNNDFALNIILLLEDSCNLESEVIRENIESVQEMKANTIAVNVYKYNFKAEEKKIFYTENGKFSRVRAIEFFKENFEKLTKI